MLKPVKVNTAAEIRYTGKLAKVRDIANGNVVYLHKHEYEPDGRFYNLFWCFPDELRLMFTVPEELFSVFHVTIVYRDGTRIYLPPDANLIFDNSKIAWFELEDNDDYHGETVGEQCYDVVPMKYITPFDQIAATCASCGYYSDIQKFKQFVPKKYKLADCLSDIRREHISVPLCFECVNNDYIKTNIPEFPYIKKRAQVKSARKT